MNKLPKVVIVGRMNVGKSTLFNRLSTTVKSLTLDFSGVTRDFIADVVSWQGLSFQLIDSGGISLKKAIDPLTEKVRQIALSLIEQADLVLFVCDGKTGFLPEDREIYKFIQKSHKDAVVVVNKIDSITTQDHLYEFQRLGASDLIAVSAQHGTGSGDLLDHIVTKLEKKHIEYVQEDPKFNVVFLGKPNVGKSSLMNALLEQERSIVAQEAGTTREPITEQLRFYQEIIQLTDTPGIRRKRGVTETLETMMVKTSFKAVERANIVLLLIEGTEGQLSDQELKLAFYAFENNKALIILINKDDLMTDQNYADLEREFDKYDHLMKKIPKLFISCKTGKNLGKILPLVTKVWDRYNTKFSEQELTELFKNALVKTPLYHKSSQLIVRRVKQIKVAPLIFLVIVNEPLWFGQSQLAFFENILRKKYDLMGAPIKLIPRKKD
jgi:GTPase